MSHSLCAYKEDIHIGDGPFLGGFFAFFFVFLINSARIYGVSVDVQDCKAETLCFVRTLERKLVSVRNYSIIKVATGFSYVLYLVDEHELSMYPLIVYS